MKNFKSTGFVLGNLWCGDKGFYPAEKLEAKTKRGLLKEARQGIKEGWLDAGMGFESLTGAILVIETIDSIKKNDKVYKNSESEIVNLGLSQKEFKMGLETIYLNN